MGRCRNSAPSVAPAMEIDTTISVSKALASLTCSCSYIDRDTIGYDYLREETLRATIPQYQVVMRVFSGIERGVARRREAGAKVLKFAFKSGG